MAFSSDSDPLIFGPLELDYPSPTFWPSHQLPPPDTPFASADLNIDSLHSDLFPDLDADLCLARWTNQDDPLIFDSPSYSSPIPIPDSPLHLPTSDFVPYKDTRCFPSTPAEDPLFPSPSQPPRSLFADPSTDPSADLKPPHWASQLWDVPHSASPPPLRPTRAPISTHGTIFPHSYSSPQAQSFPDLSPSSHLFYPASAPSHSTGLQGVGRPRAYSQRAGSSDPSLNSDPDATVRKKKRTQPADPTTTDRIINDNLPQKSELRPPKLAPSTWQLYFTDWIQRHQMNNDKKLNVAQAAKEAGSEYAALTPEQKEPFKRRSQAAKEARERELTAWQRTLTPDDIKRENAFRTAQRRAGKSRKGNIKDPNAPKKPLSAYFMFLHYIRSDAQLVREVFGDEKETTSQSVLAAAKWRSMTDEERKPFLAQAEKEKLDYEAARRIYEEGTPGFETTISFNVPPPPPGKPAPKFSLGRPSHVRDVSSESEFDSEGFVTDEGEERHSGYF